MPYAAIGNALNRAIGLDPASIGPTALASAVQSRMSACGLATPEAYAARLAGDAQELRALVEAVVVPETWFFRDREAFAAVREVALQRAREAQLGAKLRLVSLPCSTGEEPYSLAMALLDAGLPHDAFEIHAFDVSRVAIERAMAGVYRRNSFRGEDLEFRSRHFVEAAAGSWRIRPEVAACVRFAQANLLEIQASTSPASYDFVFCRNLLIYFDAATQQRAIGILRNLLRPGGRVLVGPGDANLLLSAGLEPVQRPRSFCFREPTRNKKVAAAPAISRRPVPAPAPMRPGRHAFSTPQPPPAQPAAANRPTLAHASSLADLGRTAEAVLACEALLAHGEASADVWRLLGVLREAGHDLPRAAECYRKALYLDPVDIESLDHLALLLQRQGDALGARRVRERARRLTAREAC